MKLDEITKKSTSKRLDLNHLKPCMYRTKEEVENWMNINKIKGQVDPTNLMINVSDTSLNLLSNDPRDVFVKYQNRKCLPVCFHNVNGVCVSNIGIENFYGSPSLVRDNFWCMGAELNDEDGFSGMSGKVGGHLNGSTVTHISNFKGLENCDITHVYFGGDTKPNEAIETAIKIDNIVGLPKVLKLFFTYNLRSVSGIHKQCPNLECLHFSRNVPDGLLSILRTNNRKFEFKFDANKNPKKLEMAYEIIRDHVFGDRNVFECQEEMLINGLKEYAKL